MQFAVVLGLLFTSLGLAFLLYSARLKRLAHADALEGQVPRPAPPAPDTMAEDGSIPQWLESFLESSHRRPSGSIVEVVAAHLTSRGKSTATSDPNLIARVMVLEDTVRELEHRLGSEMVTEQRVLILIIEILAAIAGIAAVVVALIEVFQAS